METITICLLVANLLALLLLLWRQQTLHRASAETARALAALPVSPLGKSELAELLGVGKRPLIVVEILNPMELAAKESWFAKQFGSLTPALIREIVYARTLDILVPQLTSFGVKADVRVSRAA